MWRFALAVTLSVAAVAAPVHAHGNAPVEDFQREPKRKGLYWGFDLATGLTPDRSGFIPSVGTRMEIGGGLSDRLMLGFATGAAGHLGIRKGFAQVVDVVLQGFVHRGLFFQLGLGVTSHAPSLDRRARPGFGGLAGIGWEFRPQRRFAVSVRAQYDGRARIDGIYTQAVMLCIGLRAYGFANR